MLDELNQSYKGSGRTKKMQGVPQLERQRRKESTDELQRLMQGKQLTDGKTFHVMTAGWIDYASNIFWLIRQYGSIKRLFVASWALAGADILLLREECERGTIRQLDILHDNDYAVQRHMDYELLLDMHDKGLIHSLTRSTMHCKMVIAEVSSGEKFVIITSANLTYNPRVEIETITISSQLYDLYSQTIELILDEQTESKTLRNFSKSYRYVSHTDVTI